MLISRLSSDTAVRCIFPQAVRIRAASSISQQKRKSRFPAADEGLTLDHFLMRSKVLALYRSFCRETKGLGSLSARWETVDWIRSEFEQHRNERNLAKIKALLSNGKRQLKQLSNSGMLVGHDGENFRGRRAIN